MRHRPYIWMDDADADAHIKAGETLYIEGIFFEGGGSRNRLDVAPKHAALDNIAVRAATLVARWKLIASAAWTAVVVLYWAHLLGFI